MLHFFASNPVSQSDDGFVKFNFGDRRPVG